jgi:hypothetical protein
MPYYVGQAINLSNWTGPLATPTGGYRNASGTLYDPTTPTLRYKLPGAAVVSVTGGSLTKDGVGLYHSVVTPAVDGVIFGAWLSNDGAYHSFTVDVQPAPI